MIPLRDINPTERFAIITFCLIIINVVVFIFEMSLAEKSGAAFVGSFALVPARLFAQYRVANETIPVLATLISSMFLHGGLLHLAGNMLFLWIFGNNVEDATGRVRYFLFYLLCGVFAALVHAYLNRSSLMPMIGASGAISGVLGAYLLLYPRARVVTLVFFGFFIRTIEMPAMFVLGFWFVLQFLNALLSGGSAGGVAWYAHVGGFFAGIVLIGPFKRSEIPFGGGGRVPRL